MQPGWASGSEVRLLVAPVIHGLAVSCCPALTPCPVGMVGRGSWSWGRIWTLTGITSVDCSEWVLGYPFQNWSWSEQGAGQGQTGFVSVEVLRSPYAVSRLGGLGAAASGQPV